MKGIKNIKVNKKKIIILVSLVVLLVATGCLNYFLTVKQNQADQEPVDAGLPTFFETYRTDREATRAQEILYLEDIISSANSDEETITGAKNKKLELVGCMETELALEGLIKAKGFSDCVVTISSENVNVVVADSELTLEETAQIMDIIESETDFTCENVIVIPYV